MADNIYIRAAFNYSFFFPLMFCIVAFLAYYVLIAVPKERVALEREILARKLSLEKLVVLMSVFPKKTKIYLVALLTKKPK